MISTNLTKTRKRACSEVQRNSVNVSLVIYKSKALIVRGNEHSSLIVKPQVCNQNRNASTCASSSLKGPTKALIVRPNVELSLIVRTNEQFGLISALASSP